MAGVSDSSVMANFQFVTGLSSCSLLKFISFLSRNLTFFFGARSKSNLSLRLSIFKWMTVLFPKSSIMPFFVASSGIKCCTGSFFNIKRAFSTPDSAA